MFRDRNKEAGVEIFRLKESSGLVEWVKIYKRTNE
jgi:hypothetical protein